MAKVLVVADEESVRDWMIGILQRHGYTTLETADPRKVFSIVEVDDPDVVVMNSQIGSMGMMAITREIKSAESAGTIGTTGVCVLLDRRADVFLARRAEADAWLVNPVHPSALRWTVDQLIEAPAAWTEEGLEAELAGHAAGSVMVADDDADDTGELDPVPAAASEPAASNADAAQSPEESEDD